MKYFILDIKIRVLTKGKLSNKYTTTMVKIKVARCDIALLAVVYSDVPQLMGKLTIYGVIIKFLPKL